MRDRRFSGVTLSVMPVTPLLINFKRFCIGNYNAAGFVKRLSDFGGVRNRLATAPFGNDDAKIMGNRPLCNN